MLPHHAPGPCALVVAAWVGIALHQLLAILTPPARMQVSKFKDGPGSCIAIPHACQITLQYLQRE